jgi:hypothetical protein
MKKIIRLTESDLVGLIKRVIKEDETDKSACFDINKLKQMAQPFGIRITTEKGLYPGDPMLYVASSQNGQISAYLNESQEPFRARTNFYEEITYEDLARAERWSKSNGGGLVDASGTYKNTYEVPQSVTVWFERPGNNEKMKCGDYERVKNILQLMGSFIKFMGPNFKRI